MNQTLARSINTSLVAILPVLSVLVVGAYILGRDDAAELRSGPRRSASLSGAYSSIFIASPLLALMKEREPRFRELAERARLRSGRARSSRPAAAALLAGADGASAPRRVDGPRHASAPGTPSRRAIQARARKQKRR